MPHKRLLTTTSWFDDNYLETYFSTRGLVSLDARPNIDIDTIIMKSNLKIYEPLIHLVAHLSLETYSLQSI